MSALACVFFGISMIIAVMEVTKSKENSEQNIANEDDDGNKTEIGALLVLQSFSIGFTLLICATNCKCFNEKCKCAKQCQSCSVIFFALRESSNKYIFSFSRTASLLVLCQRILLHG